MEMIDGGRITPSGAKTGHSHNIPPAYITYALTGTLAVATSSLPFMFPTAATILGVCASVTNPPSGDDIILDANLNGTTIFTTQDNRPRIVNGESKTSGIEVTTMDITQVAAGDLLTVNIDQVGSSFAGSNLVVVVRYTS